MLRRYRKLQEDMPLLSGEDRGRYFGKRVFYIKTNVIYLPLSSSIFLYLPLPSSTFLYLLLSSSIFLLYQWHSCSGTFLSHLFWPYARLYFTYVCFVQHYHTKAALSYSASYAEWQVPVKKLAMEI